MLLLRICIAFGALGLGSMLAAAEPPPTVEKEYIKAMYPVSRHYTKPQKPERPAIHLPESVLRDLVAKMDAKRPGSAPVGGVYDVHTVLPAIPHGATIFAGMAISLAMISLVVLRRNRPAWWWLGSGVALLFAGVVLADYLQANAPAPLRDPRQKIEPQEQCLIVVTDSGEPIHIFVPKESE